MLAVLVQPFVPVTVTVYVPACVTVTLAFVPKPPVHWYVPPPVAVRLTLVVAQPKTVEPVLFVIPAFGGVVFSVIMTEAVAVHPSDPVTVTV